MNITNIPDLQSLCRTCLSQHNNDSDIFSGKCFNEQTFSAILMDYASIQVCKNERLSSFICHSCAEYLKTFAVFRNKCIETESALCDFVRDSRFDIEIKKGLENNITDIDKDCSFSMQDKISFRQCLRTDIDSCTKDFNEPNIVKVKTEVDDEETNGGSTQSCFSTSYERGPNETLRTYLSLQESIDIKEDNEDFVDDENTTSEVSIDVDERSSFSNLAQKFSSDTRNECEQVLIKCESSDGPCVTDSDNWENRSLESRRIRSGHDSFTCDSCSGSFETKTHFDEHLKTHCEEKEDLYVHSKKKKPFACDLCTKSFFNTERLAAHKNMHCGRKPFKCNECEKSFSSKANLDQHKKVHTREKPFKCDTCGMKFALKNILVRHSYLHSKKKKPFACDLCTKSFFNTERLVTHKNMHFGRKPFKCNECEKSFSSKANLDQHKKVHTSEKPFKCNTCGKSFNTKRCLDKHSYVHSKKKRPYACDLCTKSFFNADRLAAHKNVHLGKKPFKCNECEKSFLSDVYLNKHKTVHTDEKPFVCGVCGAAFRLKEYLLKHTYLHTGQQMPHQCEMCEKSYFYKSELKKHQVQAHK